MEVGFNVAVMADGLEKNNPYFIILYDKPLFLNPETFIDEWSNEWPKRELLIRVSTTKGYLVINVVRQ